MKRIAALLLALCLTFTLAACAPQEEETVKGADVLSQVSGLDADAVMLTVDGREVTNQMYLYWLTYTMESLSSSMPSWVDDAGLLKWDEAASEDMTVEELVRQETLNTAKMYMVVENWAEKYGIALTEDETAIIDQDLDSYAQQLGSPPISTAASATPSISTPSSTTPPWSRAVPCTLRTRSSTSMTASPPTPCWPTTFS